jgi:hypothetical protein
MRRKPNTLSSGLIRVVDLFGHYFPGLLVGGELVGIYLLLREPRWELFVGLCAAPYLVPLFLYRLMALFSPIKIGGSTLAKGVWSSWFILTLLWEIRAICETARSGLTPSLRRGEGWGGGVLGRSEMDHV